MKRWPGVVLALLLSACATSERPSFAPDVTAMNSTLIGGMSQIRDKALDPPDIDRLFIAGLAHLSSVDPALHADATDAEITLTTGDQTIARAPRPRAQDIAAWTETSETLIEKARTFSKPLAAANSEQLLQAIFEGLTPLLDPYTRYYGRRDARRNQVARNGFVGLGFDLETVPKGALVRLLLKDGPADQAGVQPGDVITRVQGQRLAGEPLPTILRRLDGARETTVRLRLLRGNAEFETVARRSLIIPETVQAETTDGVLHLTIKSFNQRTAAGIAEKVSAAGPLRGVILDLRGDPGGLLDQAVAVADLFLDKGVIATLRGRHAGAMQFYAATTGDIAPGVPIVMLIDGRSASAAEILGAALQDNGRAIAVGTATVGKGTVQTIIPLANGGELALTWSRVITPAGTLLSGRGVLPDICTGATKIGAQDLIEALLKAGPKSRPPAEIVRSVCRPEPRSVETVDLDVAQRLVNDAGLRDALKLPEPGQIATTH